MFCIVLLFLHGIISCADANVAKTATTPKTQPTDYHLTIIPGVYVENSFIRGISPLEVDIPSSVGVTLADIQTAVITKTRPDRFLAGRLTVSSSAKAPFDTTVLIDTPAMQEKYSDIAPAY